MTPSMKITYNLDIINLNNFKIMITFDISRGINVNLQKQYR